MRVFAGIGLCCALLISVPVAMADDVRTERVQFERGASGATVKGKITGRQAMHYLIGANAGQFMDVTLETRNTSTYFNIFAPGQTPGESEAMFIGDRDGNRFSGTLPDSGEYLVQVYLYRNAARKGETSRFNLAINIGADASKQQGGGNDALVPGTDFNATGPLPCARNAGQPTGQCDFGVKREGGGSGTITIFWPDGGNRVIFFEGNRPTSYDQSEADGGAKMSVTEDNGLFAVKIGNQRFEIVESIMAGG